jgi:hypothetical protein
MTDAEAAAAVMPAPMNKACESPDAQSVSKVCETCCLARHLQAHPSYKEMATKTGRAYRTSDRDVPRLRTRPPRARVAVWWSLVTSANILGAAGAAGHFHSSIALALAAAEISMLLLSALTLVLVTLAVALRGTNETCERLFRLLRWASNSEEPPVPPRPTDLQAELEPPTVTTNTRGDANIGVPPVGDASSQQLNVKRTRQTLPVYPEPLPDGVITLRQWAQRIGRARSTVTHWQQRPGFPSPVGRLPIQGRHWGGVGESLYSETQLDYWHMTQAGLH